MDVENPRYRLLVVGSSLLLLLLVRRLPVLAETGLLLFAAGIGIGVGVAVGNDE
jgi:hypothetical protein